MVREEIVGTYWYVINNGRRWITQGDKPVRMGNCFSRTGSGMGWLCLDLPQQIFTGKGKATVNTEDFAELKFPEVESETPIEIEIVKSGKVFVYES